MSADRRTLILGILFAVSSNALFSLRDVAIKIGMLAGDATVHVAQIVFLIYIGALAYQGAPALRRHGIRSLRSKAPMLQAIRGVSLLVFSAGCFVAYRELPMTQVYAILFTTPFLATALSIPLLGQHVGIHRWSAIAVGLFGSVLVLHPQAGGIVLGLGVAAAFCAAGALAVFTVTVPLVAKAETTHTPTAVWPNLIVIAGAAAMLPSVWQPIPPLLFAAVVGAGVISGLATDHQVRSFTLAAPAVASPFQYTRIVWSVLAGALLWGEIPDAMTIAGATIIVGSGFYILHREIVHRQRLLVGEVVASNGVDGSDNESSGTALGEDMADEDARA